MVEKILAKSVRLMFVGGVAVTAFAQTAMAQEAAQAVQRVEVTGSSLKRVDSETALPVTVVTKTEIDRLGVTSTQELLSTITAIASAGSTTNAAGAGNSTGGLSSISLRGIGDARTLVLVNGRRLATFANGGGAVNINVIPLAAIERVEVLKDGASGIYGSDAMAGVVNFILKKKYEGIEVSSQLGSPTNSGGGQNGRASIVAGFDNDNGLNGVISGSYEKAKALFGKDRAYANTATRKPFYSSGATGQGNIQGGWTVGGGMDQATGGSGIGNPLAATDQCGTIGMSKLTKSGGKIPYCAYDSGPDVGLTPDRELLSVSGSLNYKVNANVELFADGLFSRSKVTQTYQASPARSDFFDGDSLFDAQKVEKALLIYPTNPVYNSIAVPYLNSIGKGALIGQPLAITARVKDFGPRSGVDTADQYRMLIGAKGTIADQDYEVAYATNQSKLTSAVTSGYFSQVGYAKAINDVNSNWNPWAPGGVQNPALTSAIKAASFSGDYLTQTSKSNTFDAKITGELLKVGESTWQYAAGVQSTKETINFNPSAAYQAGDIAGLGGAVVPLDKSRTVNSLFGELNIPLLKNLDGNLSARSDRYNDVGNTTNYKANFRYQPTKEILFRTSYGTGFRAPTLNDLWYPQTVGSSGQFNDTSPTGSGQTNIQIGNETTGGNPNLQPEKSKQFSVGVVLQPTNNLSLGADFFRIRISNYISAPSEQEVVDGFRRGDPAYKGLVTIDAGNNITAMKVVTANAGTADVQGLDVFANWKDKFAFGGMNVNFNGTYMHKFDQTSPGGVLYGKVGTLVNDVSGVATPVVGAKDGGVIMRWKHQVAVTWSRDVWESTIVQNFSSGYRTPNNLNDQQNYISAFQTFDLNVKYKGIKNATLSAGLKTYLTDIQTRLFLQVTSSKADTISTNMIQMADSSTLQQLISLNN